LGDTHTEKFLCPPVFVKDVIRILPQLFHVCSDQHLTELDEVTVILVVDLHNTPRIRTTTDFAAISRRNDPVRSNDSERYFARDFFMLSNGFFILVVIGGCLEDVNVMVSNVGKNLYENYEWKRQLSFEVLYPLFELCNFLVRHGISLGNDGNQVDLGVKPAHELDVYLFQPLKKYC